MGSSWARARGEAPRVTPKRAAPSIASSRARRLAIAGHPSLANQPRQGASRANPLDAEPPGVIHGPSGPDGPGWRSVLEEAVLAGHRLSRLDLHRPGPRLL